MKSQRRCPGRTSLLILNSVLSFLENGQSYTWVENAHEFRLTPWNNDPVSDAGGEAFYMRDEESGHFWTPMPLQRKGQVALYYPARIRVQRFLSTVKKELDSEVWIYVDIEAPIKFVVLKIKTIGKGQTTFHHRLYGMGSR